MAAEQSKLSVIKAHKKIEALNIKYRGDVLRGREGRINAVIHDEIDGTLPGDCEMIPIINEEKGLIKYETHLDLNNPEHALGFEYGEAIRSSMEEAQQYTFDILEVELPAASELSISKYWVH